MNNDQQQNQQNQQNQQPAPGGNQQGADQSGQSQQQAQPGAQPDFDALANKKPEELTPEELRLMADTMPGEGPGD
jgi:spore germination cell wall hydrolase CwlJ-like protein